MSIDIDWHSLTTGPSGQELAASIRDFIHDKFQQVQLPRFIRSVNVHSFNFGEECPVVELKDISDPLDEFYEDDSDSDGLDEGTLDSPIGEDVLQSPPLNQPPPPARTSSTTPRPSLIDTRFPSFRPGISTPFLSHSTTPGIPGGASNLSYFHLPLSAGLSGTQTPLAPWHEHQNHPTPPVQHNDTQQHAYADPSSRPSTSHTLPLSIPPPFAEPQLPPSLSGDRSQDLQTTLHISYSGSLSLSLTAEILLDYPMPSFVGIPLKLQITGMSFDGVALLAYLRQPNRNKVNFCFLGAEDGRAVVEGDREERGSEWEDGALGKGGGTGRLGGLLREIRVESEIGRQEDGKQVLKNVGKVEKFVLEQVRRIFEDEFVWPSFWTFLV